MAYDKKTWKDTIAEYPNRRVLTDVSDGSTQTVTVTRSVGTVSQEGDAWNAENMNDLEDRIDDEFTSLNSNLTLNTVTLSSGETSLEITDSRIQSNSSLDLYFGVEDGAEVEPISYSKIKFESGKATLTFDSMDNDVVIKYRVW